jgi:hypothetical protein
VLIGSSAVDRNGRTIKQEEWMRLYILAAGAALALTACGGTNNAADNAAMNDPAMNSMAVDNSMMADPAMNGGMDGNMATNATTENMMMNDMNTNDPDTNLANGM